MKSQFFLLSQGEGQDGGDLMSKDSGNGHSDHDGDAELSPQARRSLAMQELLIEKGVVSRGDIQRKLEELDARSPTDGAKVVARAWVDPQFKERLLAGARAAVGEIGYTLAHDSELVAVENTDQVHHMVVCTLCSCYPRSLLGPPPDWYKSLAYRSRAVSDPRGVMREFGLELEGVVEVRVLDSTADLRYMVLPLRPYRTPGMSEEELAALVTRDSMIGVAQPLAPGAAVS